MDKGAGWALPREEDDYTCVQCGSTDTTPYGAGCWWCEPERHPEPDEVAAWMLSPEEENLMVAEGMLYITTKLAEMRLTGELS